MQEANEEYPNVSQHFSLTVINDHAGKIIIL